MKVSTIIAVLALGIWGCGAEEKDADSAANAAEESRSLQAKSDVHGQGKHDNANENSETTKRSPSKGKTASALNVTAALLKDGQYSVRFTNESDGSVNFSGWGRTSIPHSVQYKTSAAGEWEDLGIGYCGTGLEEHELEAGDSVDIVSPYLYDLPEDAKFLRVGVWFYLASGDESASTYSPEMKIAP